MIKRRASIGTLIQDCHERTPRCTRSDQLAQVKGHSRKTRHIPDCMASLFSCLLDTLRKSKNITVDIYIQKGFIGFIRAIDCLSASEAKRTRNISKVGMIFDLHSEEGSSGNQFSVAFCGNHL